MTAINCLDKLLEHKKITKRQHGDISDKVAQFKADNPSIDEATAETLAVKSFLAETTTKKQNAIRQIAVIANIHNDLEKAIKDTHALEKGNKKFSYREYRDGRAPLAQWQLKTGNLSV